MYRHRSKALPHFQKMMFVQGEKILSTMFPSKTFQSRQPLVLASMIEAMLSLNMLNHPVTFGERHHFHLMPP
tara:strand:- start:643 stop:858 length:216 start_codon:yes stop_codon:yes gene_type:complete